MSPRERLQRYKRQADLVDHLLLKAETGQPQKAASFSTFMAFHAESSALKVEKGECYKP